MEVVKFAYDLAESSKVAALEPVSSSVLGMSLWQSLIRYGSFALVGLLVLLLVVRPVIRWLIGRPEGRGGRLQLPKTVGELETELVGEAEEDGGLKEARIAQQSKREGRKEVVHQIAKDQPERLVSATRTWIQDEQA